MLIIKKLDLYSIKKFKIKYILKNIYKYYTYMIRTCIIKYLTECVSKVYAYTIDLLNT